MSAGNQPTPEMLARVRQHVSQQRGRKAAPRDEGVNADSPPAPEPPADTVSPSQEEAAPQEPSSQEPSESPGSPEIPPQRVQEILQKNKEHRLEREAQQQEITRLRNEVKKFEREAALRSVSTELPDDWDQMSEVERMVHVADRVGVRVFDPESASRMERATIEWHAAKLLGVNPEQAEAVVDVLADAPGLSHEDALMLARSRKPELFPSVTETATSEPDVPAAQVASKPRSRRSTPAEPEDDWRDMPAGRLQTLAASRALTARLEQKRSGRQRR